MKLLKKLSFYFELLLNAFVGSQKGLFFITCFNLRSYIFSYSSRVRYTGNKYIYHDTSMPGLKRSCSHEQIGNDFYYKGFRNRLNLLGSCYMLDKIRFKDKDKIIDCGANIGDIKLWFDWKNSRLNIRVLNLVQ